MPDFALRGSIDLDSSRFVSGLEDAETAGRDLERTMDRSTRDMSDGLEKVERSSVDLARTVDRTSQDVGANLKRTATLADALGKALGPELSASIGQANIDTLAAELDRAGMSAQDVERHADSLQAELREVAAAADQVGNTDTSVRRLGSAMDDTAARTDNTRSVVANFAGNATQELPGVAGQMGPLNMAMGQFGEYATEGNIALKSFLTSGVALASVAFVMTQISNVMKRSAETKAFDAKQVTEWADAIYEADDAAEGLFDTLADAGKIEVHTLFQGVEDVTAILDRAGISARDWTAAVQGGADGLTAVRSALDAAGIAGRDHTNVMTGLEIAQRKYVEATDLAELRTRIFGSTSEHTSELAGRMAEAQEQVRANSEATAPVIDTVSAAIDAERSRAEEAAAALDAQRQATDDLYNANLQLVGGDLAVAEAQDRAREAVEKYTTVVEDAEADEYEKAAATRDATQAALGAAEAATRYREDQAAANGETFTAQDRARVMAEEMGKLASTMAPGSPIRTALEGYISDLRRIPSRITTALDLRVTGTRVTVGGDLVGGDQRASGGGVPAGWSGFVGERGPEIATFGSSAYVTPTHAITSALAYWQTPTVNPTVTVAAPDVRVYVGERELTDIVRVEVNGRTQAQAQRLRAGLR